MTVWVIVESGHWVMVESGTGWSGDANKIQPRVKLDSEYKGSIRVCGIGGD